MQIDGRDPLGVPFACCYGYIRALIDALVPVRIARPPESAHSAATRSSLAKAQVARGNGMTEFFTHELHFVT